MYAHTTGFDGHDCALPELLFITRERRDGGQALLFCAQRDKTNDPAVRLPADYRNLAEVLVECDHRLMISMRLREDVGVTGITRPIRNALDLVSCGTQDVASAAPDAAVEQRFHSSAIG